MRYRSVNAVEEFDFHDSRAEGGELRDGTLLLPLRSLNIHKHLPQNPSEYDMEIELAILRAEGFALLEYSPCPECVRDEQGNFVPIEPRRVYRGEDGLARFARDLGEGFYVFGWLVERKEGAAVHTITCNGQGFVSDVSFTAEKITVEWDSYTDKAWYESDEWRKYRASKKE